MIEINNIETCRTLTNEYLNDLENMKVLYMDNSMIYALEQERVKIINNLLRSKYQDMDLIKQIVEKHFHIMVLMPIIENSNLDNEIISYIIDNINNINLPTNPDWVKMNNNPKEFFEMLILDTLYLNENISDILKKKLDKKCSSFFVECMGKSDEIKIVNKREDLTSEHNYKRFVIYKGITFEGLESGLMGLNSDINKLFAIGVSSNDIILKSIPIGFLNDTEIHEYNSLRLQLLLPGNFYSKKFLFIKGNDFVIVDECDILEVKKLINGEFRTAKHYHIEEYGEYYKVINRQHTFVFNPKENRIIDILEKTA